jgi:DNA repair protein RadC
MSKNLTFDFEGNENTFEKQEIKAYQVPVYRVSLVRESSQSTPSPSINKPAEAYEIIKSFLADADREYFVVVMLDTKSRIIGINTVAIGILNSCPVHPREVFKPAIISNSARIVLGHNHPSGDPSPSSDDLMLTKRLKEAGEVLGIEVADHIIIGDGNYRSLREYGQFG